MSQTAHQKPAAKHTLTSDKERRDTPVSGLSPDDSIDVKPPPDQPPACPGPSQQ